MLKFLFIASILTVVVKETYGEYKPHWIIVFDAGSTKTRMNLFQLQVTGDGVWNPRKSISKTWKKALSRFNPDSIVDQAAIETGFRKLLTYAKREVRDSDERKLTPVFLFATAGLRALPKIKAIKLLMLSRSAIRKSGFDKMFLNQGPKRVQMISGATEGIYAWLSVNYLASQNFEQQRASEDFGVIDMGGGSTQIVFRPNNKEVVKAVGIPSESLWKMEGMKFGPGVYSKSFPGFGLSATVMKYLNAFDDCGNNQKCPNRVYSSKCLHPNFQTTFKFGPSVIQLKGKPIANPSNRYSICAAKAKAILRGHSESLTSIANLLKGKPTTFYGIAGYYYVARFISRHMQLQTANTGDTERCVGYRLTVDMYKRGARMLCAEVSDGKRDIYEAYECISSTYVSTLLSDGYQLPGNSVVLACKALTLPNRGESRTLKLGWPLGVALEGAETILEDNLNSIEN